MRRTGPLTIDDTVKILCGRGFCRFHQLDSGRLPEGIVVMSIKNGVAKTVNISGEGYLGKFRVDTEIERQRQLDAQAVVVA